MNRNFILCSQIIFLERRLADLQESSSVLLRESQNKAERQISELRYTSVYSSTLFLTEAN